MKTTKATKTINATVIYTICVSVEVPADFNEDTATEDAIDEVRSRILDSADYALTDGVEPAITDCDIEAICN